MISGDRQSVEALSLSANEYLDHSLKVTVLIATLIPMLRNSLYEAQAVERIGFLSTEREPAVIVGLGTICCRERAP